MPESFPGSCKVALNNLISSDRIQGSDDPYLHFTEGIMNFHAHYCLDDHSSSWCYHVKVRGKEQEGKCFLTPIDNRMISTKASTLSRAEPRVMPSRPFLRVWLLALKTMCQTMAD